MKTILIRYYGICEMLLTFNIEELATGTEDDISVFVGANERAD